MHPAQKVARRHIVVGSVSVYLTLLLWRLAARHMVLSGLAFELVNMAANLSLCLVPLLLTLRTKEHGATWACCSSGRFKQLLVGVALGTGMACVFTLLPLLLGLKNMVYTGVGYRSVGEALYRLGYFVLVIGGVEEFLFRGFFYGKLKEICLSDVVPVLLSSLLFGLLHFTGMNFFQVLTTGLLGAFFCICMEHIPCCSLLSLAVAHGIHDWAIRLLAPLF